MFSPNIQPPNMVSPVENEKQFKPGLVSFVLGLATITLFCIGIMLFVNAASLVDPQNIFYDRDSLTNLSVPMVMALCCSPILSLAGIGFGIAAVVRKVENKIFGIIGLIINSLFFFAFCMLTVVGTVFG